MIGLVSARGGIVRVCGAVATPPAGRGQRAVCDGLGAGSACPSPEHGTSAERWVASSPRTPRPYREDVSGGGRPHLSVASETTTGAKRRRPLLLSAARRRPATPLTPRPPTER